LTAYATPEEVPEAMKHISRGMFAPPLNLKMPIDFTWNVACEFSLINRTLVDFLFLH
jgi:hypothetical protein